MDFKQYFVYQIDYQHWANDILFSALDRLDEESRHSQQPLFFGSIHKSVDHFVFFHRKWLTRLKGERQAEAYSGTPHTPWRDLKASLRQDVRALQKWLELQPVEFFDSKLQYHSTLGNETRGIWVRDALTHICTYASLQRGQISAAAGALGAPFPNMSYYTYRLEMGEHLEHLRRAESELKSGN